MFTDLFSALLNRENRRGHPFLSAMLYGFCPAAAHWWLVGAEPHLPFDPVWQAVKDWSPETSLAERLQQYGLGDVLDIVQNYVEAVDHYRFQHRNIRAPELLPFFSGEQFPLNRRFGVAHGIRNLGGDWKNLFIYVRTWAFLLHDWRAGMQMTSDLEYRLKVETVLLTFPDYRQPAHFESLVWRVQTGHVCQPRLGLLVRNGEQDLLRFGLLGLSSPPGNQPWPNLPMIYALDRESGEAKLVDLPVSNREFPKLIRQLSRAAQGGPYPPLVALKQPSLCKWCGYQHLCYHNAHLAPQLLVEA